MIKKEEMTISMLTLIGRIFYLFIPPIVIKFARIVKNLLRKPVLEYAPDGWQTHLNNSKDQSWNVASVVDTEKSKWEAFSRNLEGWGPLGFSHEHSDLSIIHDTNFHNVHISYAYVLTLTAHHKDRISVLDWGGSLGHYYLVAKAVLPNVIIDYHIKEVPLMAEAGKQLNPEVHWYIDETCLGREYDLVMLNGSIGYMEDWVDVLHQIVRSVKEYLFLFRVLVVQHGPSFISIERLYKSQMLHQQFNQTELVEAVKKTGLVLLREFVVHDSPYIKKAPERCEMKGWLFKKETKSSL